MKFRKKPLVIEATQFFPDQEPWPEGVEGVPSPGADNWNYAGCKFFIEAIEGRVPVPPGSWIITGIRGERYPCDPGVFEATYEKVDE